MKPIRSLPSYDEALETLLSRVARLETESIDLNQAIGRTLCHAIIADRDQPPFNRATMDGFALCSREFEPDKIFSVTGSAPAGASPIDEETRPASDTTLRIATGAPLPAGRDVVVPIERAQVRETERGEVVSFHVDALPPWTNVHRRASDASKDQIILEAGTRLGLHHVGIAATMGATQLEVTRRPRATILTSGDEVRAPCVTTDKLAPHQIRNSNGPMIRAFLAALGAEVQDHQHVTDDLTATRDAAEKAVASNDIIVTTGGVSVGHRDFLADVWPTIGLETVLHGVAIQPGKPLLAAVPWARNAGPLVLGLPGNPVSSFVTAHLFLWPVLRKMLDPKRNSSIPWRQVPLAEDVRARSDRQLFRATRLVPEGTARLVTWHGSGDLMHLAKAEGLTRLPLQETVAAGTSVPFLPFAA